VKPPDGVMVTVAVAELPCWAEPLAGLIAIEKSPAEMAITTFSAEEVEGALLLSPP
jgi:hypothetical protein